MPDFRIQREQLSERREPFEFEASSSWWMARAPEGTMHDPLDRPFRFGLEACRTGESVLIEGDLSGQVGLECSRCGKRYPHALCESYRLLLEPMQDGRPEDPEGERALAENGICLGEDLDRGFYRGPVIGLDDFFGEVVALAMPIQPICREDCRGICAHCGADRNVESGAGCGCVDEKIESPFAVLAALKSQN